MDAAAIKSFAKEACDLINKQQGMIQKLASAKVTLNPELLKKASEAVYNMYGCPTTCKPEQIAAFWNEKPESLLSTIQKMASERVQQVAVTGAKLGKTITKKASDAHEMSADEVFYSQYK